nr:MarR family winged helix-turn-helix transcriptional regulator [Jiella mangrovi]
MARTRPVAKSRPAGNGDIPDAAIEGYDPRHHPAQLVRRVHQLGAQLFTQNVRYPNLSVTQFVALVTLLKLGPVAMSQLSRLTSMDPSTTTVVVRKLEREGLVEKFKSPDDQRTSVIALTEAGRRCAEEHVPVSVAAGEKLLEPLTEIEKQLFVALLRKVAEPGD